MINLKAKFLKRIVAGCVVLSSSLYADSVLTYSGNPITITLDTTLTQSQLSSLPSGTDITSDLVSFTMTAPAPSQDNAGFPLAENFVTPSDVQIGTDSLGNITSFDVTGTLFASYPAFSGESPTDFYCNYAVAATDTGSSGPLSLDNDAGFCPASAPVGGDVGTWSESFSGPSSAPEPGTNALLGGGVLALLAIATRRGVRL